MPLDQIARFVSRAVLNEAQADQLRARFHNIIESLALRIVNRSFVRDRLVYLDAHFFRNPQNRDADRVLSALALSLMATDEHFKESDHYLRPEALSQHLERRAVTIQRNQYGRLGKSLLGEKASGAEIEEAFDKRHSSGARQFISSVGAPDRPIWLTPYRGEVEQLCEEAQIETTGPARRAQIVRRIVSRLGLCHLEVGDELIAFVTIQPIAKLEFAHPAPAPLAPRPGLGVYLPVGPTPLEARDHRRYRNWPIPPAQGHGYGRTYALDIQDRAAAPTADHGHLEAVRPRMGIDAFADCIFLGSLRERPEDDTDAAYLSEIGATRALADLLQHLHRDFGV